ncbi:LPS export ABC transporter permease LptG [Halotalea alkalilenta]|uniref:LPS export ABC transporter permease LptG n=2 Tax=Halotalea alkalilenta TaxID=376489 RepID=A0A172YKQ0_9GAMM|nr:LPS export ABC transporter permease LptG [Halotalea alkalilenta]
MMFDRFDRYVARNVLAAMLITQFTLLSLDFTISFINELGDTRGDYGPLSILAYLAIRMPWRFYAYAPVAVLLGALLGLGAMASSNELTAMRAAGRSIGRLIWGVMKPLALVVIVTMAVGEWLVPQTEQAAKAYRTERIQGQGAINAVSGGWQIEGQDVYHFGAIRSDNVLIGVTRYHYDEGRLVSASYADRGVWNADERRWRLEGVRETSFEDSGTVSERYDVLDWQTSFDPQFLTLVIMAPDTQSIGSLWRFAHYQDAQGVNSNTSWLYFWQKVLQPLALAGLVLVAASFVFGPLRSVAAGTRIFYGVIVGLSFKYLQDLLAPSSILFGFSPIWAVVIPIFACFAFGAFLLRRTG